MSTRLLIEASWRAAQRCAHAEGIIRGTAATVAGQYLEAASGDPTRAIAMLPYDGGVFWARVGSVLADVAQEETAARGPRLTGNVNNKEGTDHGTQST